ncbi:conserved hypothetical protein [Uncinocarpus reesii 1704]|uniref:RTA1 domain protein n=1 Tax=Uncinocarpus reesii (strain UAMH 1704) TaxID=336963 RepID=C4JSI5_UNCRE|nr:uncharacterized protein UREG_05424 [Uncinocarpus reesii 1704]EEP80582.1 conserved hypothetical protein [Uncinocarpus reesii 1704]
MPDGRPVEGSLYIYAPNKVAPIFFAIAFAVSTTGHFWQCYHYKCFKLMGLHLLCGLMFTAGFALREYGTFNYLFEGNNLNYYIATISLIYMAPSLAFRPLLELANYHILGRILYYVPYFAPLHPGRVLTTFGMLSCIVEVMNAIGISYSVNKSLSEDVNKVGEILVKASLLVQIVVIALFCLLAGIFHQRCARARVSSRSVSAPLLTLYASQFLILARCIYRTIEHFDTSKALASQDVDLATISPLLRYEWFFYVFEATFMLINSAMWNWWHPRRYLPESYNTYLAQDGITELEGPGWKDDRPVWLTLIDPFGFVNWSGKKEKPFWETNGYFAVKGHDPQKSNV